MFATLMYNNKLQVEVKKKRKTDFWAVEAVASAGSLKMSSFLGTVKTHPKVPDQQTSPFCFVFF